MRGQRGLISLLLLLAVLCSTGFSLICYNCLDPVSQCKTNTTCGQNLDSCLYVVSGKQVYQQCWKFSDCNFPFIASRLELAKLQYRCCQVDLCNLKLEEGPEREEAKENSTKNEATSLSGKIVLLGTSVLAAIWKLCL